MLKNSLKYLVLMLIACSSCQDKQEPPKNLIPEEKMVDIMYEMALIQAIKSYDYKLMDNKNVNPSQYIYDKFGVDSLQFVESNKFYANQLERYEKMHDVVIERLKQQRKKTDSLVPQLPDSKEFTQQADNVVKPKILPSKNK